MLKWFRAIRTWFFPGVPPAPTVDAGICIDYAHEGQGVRVLALDAATPTLQTYACISNTPRGSVLRAFVAGERLTAGDLVEIDRNGRACRVRSRMTAWRYDHWPLYPARITADDDRERVIVRRMDDKYGITWTEDYR